MSYVFFSFELFQMLGRNQIEVNLAKPLSDKRKQAQAKREQRKPFDTRDSFGDYPPPRPAGHTRGFHQNNAVRGNGRSNGSFSEYFTYHGSFD